MNSTARQLAEAARRHVLSREPAASAMRTGAVRVLIAAAELFPISGRGVIGEFTAHLCSALRVRGHDVRVVIPFPLADDAIDLASADPVQTLSIPLLGDDEHAPIFRCEGPHATTVDLVGSQRYFSADSALPADDDERFVFFSKAVAQLVSDDPWNPDVVHCVEWHSAMLPDYLRTALGDTAPVSVLSIFDLERFSPDHRRGREEMDSPQLTLEIASRGVVSADAVCLIESPYSVGFPDTLPELLAPYLRSREIPVHRLRVGATTPLGADLDPRFDPVLQTTFGPESIPRRARNKQALQLIRGLSHDTGLPLIGMICRAGGAHMLRWLAVIFDSAPRTLIGQLVASGVRNADDEPAFSRVAAAYPDAFSFRGESASACAPASRAIYGGADLFLAEHEQDPAILLCLRYGALPIVPTQDPAGLRYPGFGFDPRVAGADRAALERALAVCADREGVAALQRLAMTLNPAWDELAAGLEGIYTALLAGTLMTACSDGSVAGSEPHDSLQMRTF